MTYHDITDDSIGALVDDFYGRVRRDADLGPIFAARIGDDWEPHLHVIKMFWSNVMLSDGRYRGNPMGKHLSLTDVTPEHFDIWLRLFRQTATDLFDDTLSTALIERAERIAQSLKIGMFELPGPS